MSRSEMLRGFTQMFKADTCIRGNKAVGGGDCWSQNKVRGSLVVIMLLPHNNVIA